MWNPPSLESLTIHNPKNPSKLVCATRMDLHLNAPFYLAGDTVHGRIVLHIAPHIFVGNIVIALRGEEEIFYPLLETRDPFLHSFATIQDALATPINNITGKRHWTYSGYRRAIPGKIVVPFNFYLPNDLPSSNEYKRICNVKYTIVAIAEVLRFTDPKLLIKQHPVKIYEKWNDFHHSFFSKPINAEFSKQIVLTPGLVHLSAVIERRGMNSFSKNYVKVTVHNSSLKRVHGIEIQVIKRCIIPYLPGYVLPQDDINELSDELNNPEELIKSQLVWRKKYLGAKASFDSGEFRSEIFDFFCPEDCITSRLTSLFYISIIVKVKLFVGLLTSPMYVELPIVVRPFGSAYKPPNLSTEEHIHPYHFNHLYLSIKGKERRDWLSTFMAADDSLESSENGDIDAAGLPSPFLDNQINRNDRIPWGNEMEETMDTKEYKKKRVKYGKFILAKLNKLKTKASGTDLNHKPFIVYQKTKKPNIYYGFQPNDVNLWEYRVTSNLPALQKKKMILKGTTPNIIMPKTYFNSEERCKRSFFGWYFGVCPVFVDTKHENEDSILNGTEFPNESFYGAGWWYDLNAQREKEEEFVIPTIVEPHSLKSKPSWGDWLRDSMQQQSTKSKRKEIPKEWKR